MAKDAGPLHHSRRIPPLRRVLASMTPASPARSISGGDLPACGGVGGRRFSFQATEPLRTSRADSRRRIRWPFRLDATGSAPGRTLASHRPRCPSLRIWATVGRSTRAGGRRSPFDNRLREEPQRTIYERDSRGEVVADVEMLGTRSVVGGLGENREITASSAAAIGRDGAEDHLRHAISGGSSWVTGTGRGRRSPRRRSTSASS